MEQVGSLGLVGDAIGAISRHIREKDLMPGDKLPSEALLSKELNVSRTVVREAFRSLAAMRIIEQETARFMAELHHRATGPVIRQLREDWGKPKEEELRRLLNKLPDLNEHQQEEIRRAFDRLLNKLLHRPLESLRDEAQHGIPHGLLEALSRLFHLKD